MAGYLANLEKALNAPTTASIGGGLLDLWGDIKRFRSLWGK
jgi:hypothetical protein